MSIGEMNNRFYNHTYAYQKMQREKKETENKMAEPRQNNVKRSSTIEEEKIDKFEKTTKPETYDLSKLSKAAQDYLKQLKEKFGDMDIMIADYSTEEEAQQYLAQGKKAFNVVIDPALLEKMATDEESRKKYEGIIENAPKQLEDMKKELGDDADSVKSVGISIDGNGKVTYFAMLDEQRIQNKKIQADRAEKLEEKKSEQKAEAKQKEQQKLENKVKELRIIKADTLEELLEKIKAAKNGIEDNGNLLFAKTATEEQQKGASVDFTL